jgi:hypothetical protein
MKAWWAYSASSDDVEGGGCLPNPEEFARRRTLSCLSRARVRAGHRDQPVSQVYNARGAGRGVGERVVVAEQTELPAAGFVTGQRTEMMIR